MRTMTDKKPKPKPALQRTASVNMNDHQGRGLKEQGVRFVSAKGSVIGGVGKENTARITDAVADLQLGINGLKTRFSAESNGIPAENDSNRWVDALMERCAAIKARANGLKV